MDTIFTLHARTQDGDGGQDAAGKRLAEPKPLRRSAFRVSLVSIEVDRFITYKCIKVDGGMY